MFNICCTCILDIVNILLTVRNGFFNGAKTFLLYTPACAYSLKKDWQLHAYTNIAWGLRRWQCVPLSGVATA